MHRYNNILLSLYIMLFPGLLLGYGQPRIGLGTSSFLDGGPLRLRPGVYWQELFQYYATHKFLNEQGLPLFGLPSPEFHGLNIATQCVFQSSMTFLGGHPGISTVLPMVLQSHVDKNLLGITTSGTGVGDLITGIYLQYDPIFYKGRPLLIQRIEFDVSFPSGKFKKNFGINPSNGFFFISPYWSATLYFTEQWAMSWRFNYLWNAKNKHNCLQAGQAIYLNLSTEYALLPRLWIGINSYYFRQITENKLFNVVVPNSKEQVYGVGPGLLYLATSHLFIWANLYFETAVRNRPQGTRAIMRILLHF